MSIFSVSSNVSGINVGSSWCKAVYLGTTAVFYETYTAGALSPELALDFASEYYRTGGTDTDLVSATTHARAGNATMVDSDGLLKWGPHNLLPVSEVFSGYVNSNVSLTTGQIDPKGTTTATRVTTTGANAYMIKDSGVELTGNSSIWVRRVSGSGNVDFRSIDNNTSNILTLTSVWQKFTSAQAFSANARFRLQIADSGDVIDIWGAHVYRSDLGGMVNNPARGDSYVPTTGAAVYLPRVGHHRNTPSPELLTNGTFDADTDWTKGTGWTIGSGVATKTAGTQAELEQDISVTEGNVYEVSFDLVRSAGNIELRLGTVGSFDNLTNATGSYTYYIVAGAGTPDIEIRANSAFVGSIDNISVREVTPWVNEGYFHESEARTNLLPYSQDFTDASWLPQNIATLAVDAIGPDGETSAVTLVDSGAGGTGQVDVREANVPTTELTTHTFSFFAKADQLTIASGRLANGFLTTVTSFDLSSGTVVSGSGLMEDFGNGWFRCSMTATTKVGGVAADVRIIVSETAGNVTVNLDGTSSILIYGAQFEEGSTPSSYIPTSGSTVTRAADTMTVPSANLPWNPLAVSIQMEGKMTYAETGTAGSTSGGSGDAVFYLLKENSSNYLEAVLATNNAQDVISFAQESSGVRDVVALFFGPTPGVNVPFNISSRHGSTFLNGAVDGVALTEDTTPVALPDLSATDMDIGFDFMGTIKLFRVWADDLTDAGIEDASA